MRSHKRTISATMLFTSDINKSFEDTGCEDASFEYTPLSAIDVHWTYKKGDKTIDMGYINVEVLRKNLLEIVRMSMSGKESFTVDDFAHFHSLATQAEENDEVPLKVSKTPPGYTRLVNTIPVSVITVASTGKTCVSKDLLEMFEGTDLVFPLTESVPLNISYKFIKT